MKKIIALAICAVMVFSVAFCLVGCDSDAYKEANDLFEVGKYEDALLLYKKIPDYEDSAEKIKECETILVYKNAVDDMKNKNYKDAREQFAEILEYKDSNDKYIECSNQYATELYYDGQYKEAKAIYDEIDSDSSDRSYCNQKVLSEYILNNGTKLGDNEDFGNAYLFSSDKGKYIISQKFENTRDDEVDKYMDDEYWLAISADEEYGTLHFIYFSKGELTDNGTITYFNATVDFSTLTVDVTGDIALFQDGNNRILLGKGLFVNSYSDYYPKYVEKGKGLTYSALGVYLMEDGKKQTITDKEAVGQMCLKTTNDGYQDIIENANKLLKTTGLNITMKWLGFDKLD